MLVTCTANESTETDVLEGPRTSPGKIIAWVGVTGTSGTKGVGCRVKVGKHGLTSGAENADGGRDLTVTVSQFFTRVNLGVVLKQSVVVKNDAVRLDKVTLSLGKTSNVTQRGVVSNSNSKGLSGSAVGVTTLNGYSVVSVTDDITSRTSDVSSTISQTGRETSYGSNNILRDNLKVYRVVLVNGVVLNV